MADYRAFLQRWVDWLNAEAIQAVLAEDFGLGALEAEAVAIPEDKQD
jgi:hypothetical protein